MQLSAHFSLQEFVRSEMAEKARIDNTPTREVRGHLTHLAKTLEQVRTVLGDRPILVSSGYRCAALNTYVGGVKSSAHLLGLAVDFTCPTFGSPLDVCRAIAASDIAFDQLIYEFETWVHLGLARPGHPMRRECLTINRRGKYRGLFA
ncbi:peptidase M15 [Burkholderia ubonensis]|nr:peptidase M15 [Burkholderia ubonensis]